MTPVLALKKLNRNKLQFPYHFHVESRLGQTYTPDCEYNAVLYLQACITKIKLKALPVIHVDV